MGRPFVEPGPEYFPGGRNCTGGVLSPRLVLHVLITLLSHLGPGTVIRNMLGWTLEEKTEGSGVWLFRGALEGENLFLPFFQWETG